MIRELKSLKQSFLEHTCENALPLGTSGKSPAAECPENLINFDQQDYRCVSWQGVNLSVPSKVEEGPDEGIPLKRVDNRGAHHIR